MSYDGNTKVRWEHCPWQPNPVAHQLIKLEIERFRELGRQIIERNRIIANSRFDLTPKQIQQLRDRGYNV